MDRPYVAGIVGSRRRNTLHDRKIVFRLVAWLYGRAAGRSGFMIASGGCPQGADAFAEESARLFEPALDVLVYPIDKTGVSSKWEFTTRAYQRNRKIAENSEELFCLVHQDRTGGTENTIRHALELGKTVYLVTDSGEVYLSKDGTIPLCEPVARLLDLKSTD